MYIHEYQAKQLLKKYNIKIPKGVLVKNQKPIESILQSMTSFPVFVKAQIHAGGRKKSGGIQKASSPEEAKQKIFEMLNMTIINKQTGEEGKKVEKVYVEEAIEIEKEYYISLTIDRSLISPVFIVSSSGGTEIEEVAKNTPEKITKVPINFITGVQDFHIRHIAIAMGVPLNETEKLKNLIHSIYNLFIDYDASQVEINPLVLDKNGKFFALDAKINFDNNALYRQSEILEFHDPNEENKLEEIANTYKLNFIKMNGNIGCMVNGAGLAMATMDLIKYCGGEPANFLDVGGTASFPTIMKAMELILSDQSVKVVLVNIFGGIVRTDIIVEGIVNTLTKMEKNVVILLRLLGTNSDSAKEKIPDTKKYQIIFVNDLEEATKKAIQYANAG